MKQRKERSDADSIISFCRPKRRFRSCWVMLGLDTPNAEKGLVQRISDAHGQLYRDVHFLAGFLSLLPELRFKRQAQRLHEGRTILENSFALLENIGDCPTLGYVKKMRVEREKMLGFVEKIEKDLRAEREP